MSALLLSGGRIIDPATSLDGRFELLITDGKVAAITPPGEPISHSACEVLDVTGCWVVPGLIDPHVHLRDPGFPRKETIDSGLRAAAAGGFTAVAAMANTDPVNDRPEITAYMLERAAAVGGCALVPVSAVSRNLAGHQAVDFEAMVQAGARLFSDDGLPLDDPELLLSALESVSRLGFAISLHEEDRQLSAVGAINAGAVSKQLGVGGVPAKAESERVRRDLALILGSGGAVHIAHVSSKRSLELIVAARSRGVSVTCEVTPHHLTLNEEAVLEFGPDAKMNPPLRAPEDVQALRQSLADGVIDMIATDHAPHDPESKQWPALGGYFGHGHPHPALTPAQAQALTKAANGVVGLETSLGLSMELVHQGLISPLRLVELMALNPARLLRLERGSLAPGGRADVTVIDPEKEWTVGPDKFLSRSRNTPFAGRRLKGKALMTIVAGKIVFDGRRGMTNGRS